MILGFTEEIAENFSVHLQQAAGLGEFIRRAMRAEGVLDLARSGARLQVLQSELTRAIDPEALDDVVMLQRAGFLTSRERDLFGRVTLGIPNREVQEAVAKLAARLECQYAFALPECLAPSCFSGLTASAKTERVAICKMSAYL